MAPKSGPRRPLVVALGLALLLIFGLIALWQTAEVDRLSGELAEQERRFQLRDAASQERIHELLARLEALEQSSGDPGFSAAPSVERDPADQAEIERLKKELEDLREDQLAATGERQVAFESLPQGEILLNRIQRGPPKSNPNEPSWSENQATGPPDTEGLGDFPSAWASKSPDAGEEWLEIGFSRAVVPDAIVIIESFNPGAITRVQGKVGSGGWRTIWTGRDPSTEEANEFVINMNGSTSIDTVRITLDTTLVSGWNEIDAVGLEVGDETVWGSTATASSTFGK